MTAFAEYERLSTRRAARKLDIWFLHNCPREGVTPTFAKVKTSHNVTRRQVGNLERDIVKNEIRKHYGQLHHLDCSLKIKYVEIVNSPLRSLVLTDFFNDLNDRVDSFRASK